MQGLLRWRYRALLIANLLLIAGYPILDGLLDMPLLFHALLTLVFLAALLVVFEDRSRRLLGALLAFPTVVGFWTSYALPGVPPVPLVVVFHLVGALFLAYVLATALRSIFREAAISTDNICGAFCGYLLIGVAFGHLFCAVDVALPGSFRGDADFAAEAQDQHRRHFLLTYFSLTTLTSVGYGDIVPVKGTARGLAVVEAIAGQFYIAVLIAGLIGKRASQPKGD